MVAKSFQNMKILCEPYEKNKKMYVRVLNEKTQKEREVRYYTEKEYIKLYGSLPEGKEDKNTAGAYNSAPKDHAKDPYWKPQKDVLGFTNGYITIFKGNTYAYKEYLKSIGCTYRKLWGWGLSSDMKLPEDFPTDLIPVKLYWNKIGNEEGSLYADSTVKEEVDKLIYDPGVSDWQGAIGERLDLYVTIVKALEIGDFGDILHIMKDSDENEYVWKTSARRLEETKTYHLRGTVKEHKTFRNIKQTILTRCILVKEK